MCGILGQYVKNDKVNIRLFDESLRLLTHRGPDESDHTILDDGHLLLGHTRLSIVGVENGKQPISNAEQTLYVIVNGEFYDYKTIRQEFARDGYRFKTDSDSEIILPLYQKYKYEAFNKLNGEFAGIIYDVREQKIILFRDRHGVKPLFYQHTNDDLIVASEMKAILNLIPRAPEWNIDHLKQAFSFISIQNETIYQNIFHVKPGYFMVYDLKKHTLAEHKYWQIDFDRKNYFDFSLPELTKKYETELVNAISRRLVADVPVAAYLSGGIDSSACYGIASHVLGKGIDAFTISFDQPDYDEFKQAQMMVEKYGGKHHVLKADEQTLFDNFEKHLWYMEAPTQNPHSVAKYLLSDMVRKAGFKVVLTGEGSDEYNAGYVTTVLDALKYEHHDNADLPLAEMFSVGSQASINPQAKELDYAKEIFGFSPAKFENAAIRDAIGNQLYSAKYQEKIAGSNMQRWLKQRYQPQMKNWDILNTSLYLIGKTTFDYVLSILGDRTEMAHSVEARLPFLDHHLLEFLAKVPPKYKANRERDKYLLREAVKKYVTESHYNTPKHPYLAPPFLRRNSLFATYMYDIFSSTEFRNFELFDAKKVLSVLNTAVTDEKADPLLERILFQILSLALLQKMFKFKGAS